MNDIDRLNQRVTALEMALQPGTHEQDQLRIQRDNALEELAALKAKLAPTPPAALQTPADWNVKRVHKVVFAGSPAGWPEALQALAQIDQELAMLRGACNTDAMRADVALTQRDQARASLNVAERQRDAALLERDQAKGDLNRAKAELETALSELRNWRRQCAFR